MTNLKEQTEIMNKHQATGKFGAETTRTEEINRQMQLIDVELYRSIHKFSAQFGAAATIILINTIQQTLDIASDDFENRAIIELEQARKECDGFVQAGNEAFNQPKI